jgi:two-component system, NarL family, nitrate/nitrite response regulator NarL
MGESVHHGLGLQITRPAARNARQFATNAKREFVSHAKNQGVKTPVILLLTDDDGLEDSVAQALSEIGGVSHLTRDAGDALEIICGVHDLDLAIIDFENGPHGMTLLSAISALREDLPVIVITRDNDRHIEALAYANGATACFRKPVTVAELISAIRELQRLKPEVAPA